MGDGFIYFRPPDKHYRWLSNATPLKLNDRGFDDPKLGFDTDYI